MKNDFTEEEQAGRQMKIRRSQMDMFAMQSDKGRLTRKQNLLREEIRKMKINLGHLKADLEEKIKALALLDREILQIDEELAHAKKQMSTMK
jgi:predicted  nucleic acid-binding Zn-ribbon protein